MILRFSVPWEQVQPYCLNAVGGEVWNSPPTDNRGQCVTPGPIDWTLGNFQSDLDSIKSELGSGPGQVRLLPVVIEAPTWAWGYGDVPDPTSDSSSGYNSKYPDMPPGGDSTALGWWQQFNAALVSWLENRYGRSNIAGLEVWNEEDYYPISWSLEPDQATAMALRYSQVLCSAYQGVRSIDSSLPVILGGINPQPSGDNTTTVPWLTAAYQSKGATIRNCMSAIGIHPYQSPVEAPSTPGSKFAEGASNAHRSQRATATPAVRSGSPSSATRSET